MFFASDNWAGAHPAITASLAKHADGYAPSYGASELDEQVRLKFNTLFEREVAVFFTSTGTAANALALASCNEPGAIGFCHREAHLREDECGAPEFLAPGARLHIVDGPNGKMSPENLEKEIQSVLEAGTMGGKPAFVSITQTTEAGTIHTLDEIDALVEVAKKHNLIVHLDGARFANAIDALKCTSADMTWKRGIDIVSFGGTKNGCWCAEALIFMNPNAAISAPYLQKRSGHVISKSRFVAAQFDAYLSENLWLVLAAHANKMAMQMEQSIKASRHFRMAWPRQANEVFAITSKTNADKMRSAGAKFYDWPAPYAKQDMITDKETIIRLVTNFATKPRDIEEFITFSA